MLRLTKYRLVYVWCLLSLCRCATAQVSRTDQGQTNAFSLAIRSEKPSFTAGTAVLVDATVKNNSNQNLPLAKRRTQDMDQGGWLYNVDVRDEKGSQVAKTAFYRRLLGQLTPEERARDKQAQQQGLYQIPLGSSTLDFMDPGMTRTDQVNVGKLFDLSRPGTYAVQFQLSATVISNTITITVTPGEHGK